MDSGQIVLPAAAVCMALATPSWGQQSPPDNVPATVVITGSRIARPELDQLQPIMVVGSEQIEQRAFDNLLAALDTLPAFGPPSSSKVGVQSSFGVAQSFANFFSLGSQRTLTLVNGHRFVSSNTASIFGPTDSGQQVDLNAIPTKLIDRVEVIAVGGAPVYGSDAIAGTVNIITRQDYEGLDLDATGGMTERGDGVTRRGRVLAGTNFAGGRGNVVLNGEYIKSDGLTYDDRSRTRRALAYAPPADPESPFRQVLITDRRIPVISTGGIPMTFDSLPEFDGIRDTSGRTLAFSRSRLSPYDFGTDTGSLAFASGGDGFSLNSVLNLVSPTERALFTVLAHFDVTDHVRLHAEGWSSDTRAEQLVAQSPYNSAFFGAAGDPDGNLILSTSNPFLDPTDRQTIIDNLNAAGADPSQFYLARANTELETGFSEGKVKVHRAVLGAEGDIVAGDRTYQWEVSGNYGRSVGTSKQPSLVQQNFLNAIDAVRDPATGNIVCATGGSACAPLNLFGAGSASQAARDYITTIARTRSTITQRVLTADVHGPLFDLPAGPVNAVLGSENRRETSDFQPDEFQALGLGRAIPIDPVSGAFKTDELFTELLVPVIAPHQDVPFVHSLQVEGALRYVDHSVAGGDTTWTAGLRFAPVEDVMFRGNHTRGIRAPAVTEAFSPTSQAFDLADDPCDQRFIDAGPNPTQRARNCAAIGITQPFTSNIVDASAAISVSGNPDLLNEIADSKTVGFVLRPRWVPRLSLAVDWVSIDLTDAIVSLTADATLKACYDSPDMAAAAQCAAVDRDPSGQVTFVRTGFANAGSKKFQGYTSELAYDFDVPRANGHLSVQLNYFRLKQLVTRVGLGDVNNEAGEVGNSRNQATLNLNYRRGAFSMLLQGEYYGSGKWDVDEQPGSRDIEGVGDWWLFNSSIGYEITPRFGVRLAVDNVFDKSAPFPAPVDSDKVAATYFSGLFGRNYQLNANYRF